MHTCAECLSNRCSPGYPVSLASPLLMATCASHSPRKMVWGAVQNPTRTSGGPSEDVAGVPPGLRPMPFLTACVIHAEGGVGRGPHLSGAAVLSAAVVCCAGLVCFSLVLLCLLFAGSVRQSVCALPLLLRCPLSCRCPCCCCLFRCPGLLCVVVVRLLCLTVSPAGRATAFGSSANADCRACGKAAA